MIQEMQKMEPLAVMLVDDHALVRAGIRQLVDQLSGFTVIEEASGVHEALQKLETSKPDIVITDISMRGESGLDLVRSLSSQFPAIASVILSMHASEDLVSEALKLGASAFLLKDAVPSELEIALRAVGRKETYLSPAVSTKVIERFIRTPLPVPTLPQQLTARQVQILTMIASRKGTKEIAYELGLSEKTIAAHRAQIMDRTGVRDVVGLALFAIQHGLVKVAA